MSQFTYREVSCGHCQSPFRAHIPLSLQVRRMPEVRQAAVDGTLNRVVCPNCGKPSAIELSLMYVDIDRQQVIAVLPSDAMAFARDATARIDALMAYNLDLAAAPMIRSMVFLRRVVFGLDALTELLRIRDADLDDFVIAAIKLKLCRAPSPEGLKRRRFIACTDDALVFRRTDASAPDGTVVLFDERVPIGDYWRMKAAGVGDRLAATLPPNCSDVAAALIPQRELAFDGAPSVGCSPAAAHAWLEALARPPR